MRKFIVWVLCIILTGLVGCQTVKAQSVKKEGKTFTYEKSVKSNDDIATDYTYKDKMGEEYPIFLHKYTKGDKAGKWGVYVIKQSKKTGKDYKYYIPNNEEIANTIVKELKL